MSQVDEAKNEDFLTIKDPVDRRDVETAEPAETVNRAKTNNCSLRLLECIYDFIPLFYWLPRYDFRENFFGDVIAGFSVAVYHLTQGMAYALLSEVPPIYGIYMGIFQVTVYAILGTSRHISIGSMAITTLMTGRFITTKMAEWEQRQRNLEPKIENVQVSAAVSIAVGIQQILCKFFGLGILSGMFKPSMVSGFTGGCAFQIGTVQLKNILGLTFENYKRPGWAIVTWFRGASEIRNTNPATIVISSIAIVFLVLNHAVVRPLTAKCTHLPVPIELIIIALFTGISYKFSENLEKWNVPIVAKIPSGVSTISVPSIRLVLAVFLESIPISIVAYSITQAMSFLLAGEDYVVDPNQELFALGASTFFGAFFGCPPAAASVSRSLLQKDAGGKTQMSGFICAGILLAITLTIAQYFETLPRCVLASIILWAICCSLQRSVNFAISIWRQRPEEGRLWLTAFAATVLLDAVFGLLFGCMAALRILINEDRKVKEELSKRKEKEDEISKEETDPPAHQSTRGPSLNLLLNK